MTDFDLPAAVAYNGDRFVPAPNLLDWLGRAADDPALARDAAAETKIGEAFARLVHRAQTRIAAEPQDGRLDPAAIRAIRRHLGIQSRSIGLARDGIHLPERQVSKGPLGYPDRFSSAHLGRFYVSGGFMEDHGHSKKGTTRAIFSDAPSSVRTLPPSDRNLGLDYVVQSPGKEVRAWYGGLVLAAGLDGGYGLRVTVETDVAFTLEGVEHTVYQAFGHNAALHVRRGEFVEPLQLLATMGGTGEGGAVRYGEHVDLRTWISIDNQRIDLSPNVLDRQLPAPSRLPGRPRLALAAAAIAAALAFGGAAVLAWRSRA